MTTKIEWTDETCNVVAGCTAVDAGCTNCYAADVANLHRQHFEGLTRRTGDGRSVWTGKLRYRPDMAERLLRTRKPRRVFWCSMGDLFHPDVPDEWLDHAFAVMALTPWLLHQVLTRRMERMADYLSDEGQRWRTCVECGHLTGVYAGEPARLLDNLSDEWPLPNVVAMTSVIDQQTADERVPHLLRCPARWRSVSYEPALGAVDWSLDGLWCYPCPRCDEEGSHEPDTGAWSCSACDGTQVGDEVGIDQIIAGGESGPKARPPHPQWFRDTRDACAEAGVAFFFKQWGEWKPVAPHEYRKSTRRMVYPDGQSRLSHEALPHPEAYQLAKVGKRCAGRLLDGRKHNGEPWEWRDGAWRNR